MELSLIFLPTPKRVCKTYVNASITILCDILDVPTRRSMKMAQIARSLCYGRDLFTRAFKAKLLDRVA